MSKVSHPDHPSPGSADTSRCTPTSLPMPNLSRSALSWKTGGQCQGHSSLSGLWSRLPADSHLLISGLLPKLLPGHYFAASKWAAGRTDILESQWQVEKTTEAPQDPRRSPPYALTRPHFKESPRHRPAVIRDNFFLLLLPSGTGPLSLRAVGSWYSDGTTTRTRRTSAHVSSWSRESYVIHQLWSPISPPTSSAAEEDPPPYIPSPIPGLVTLSLLIPSPCS